MFKGEVDPVLQAGEEVDLMQHLSLSASQG